MQKSRIGLTAIVAAAAALCFGANAFATGAKFACGSGDRDGKSLQLVALTSEGALVCFNEYLPRFTRTLGYVNGLVEDTALVGIDFRVQDGLLYGVGDAGSVYTVDTSNGYATLINRLTVPLAGDSFGVDFNPAADRLRIVSNTGQNLRHNVNDGGTTLADAMLNYTAGTAAVGIAGAAYTNNDLDLNTGTTLFDIDTSLNQVVIQSPPNAGSLVATGMLTVDADSPVGFDIYTTLQDGVAINNSGFASLVVGGVPGFYRVNFPTGQAFLIDYFRDPVIDIAIPLNQK